MTMYFIAAILILIVVVILLATSSRSMLLTLNKLLKDKEQLLANIAALQQHALDAKKIADWKKEMEAKIEAGKQDEVIDDIIAGNNARVPHDKPDTPNHAS